MKKKNCAESFTIGDKIKWKWLGRDISGEVVEVYLQPVAKIIKEKTIKRNGSMENPAYLVRSQVGNLALKLHSELQAITMTENNKNKPKMFS